MGVQEPSGSVSLRHYCILRLGLWSLSGPSLGRLLVSSDEVHAFAAPQLQTQEAH